MTSKHGSLSFEYSDNEYEGTLGVEWSKGNVGEYIHSEIIFALCVLDVLTKFYFYFIGGDCIFWELCGREDFLASYHHVLTFQFPAVHLITVSLREPLTVQLQQARFWLRFILDRIPPTNIGK